MYFTINIKLKSHNSTITRDYIDAHSYKVYFVNSNKNTHLFSTAQVHITKIISLEIKMAG